MLTELHCHTIYSCQKKVLHDGINTPKDIIVYARHIGLDAVCITDHNTTKALKESLKLGKQYSIVVVPGEEISTTDGHVLALGISDCIPPVYSVEETVDLIHDQGGFAIASHPFDIKNDGTREKSRFCDAIEIFNSLNIDRFANSRNLQFSRKHNIAGVVGGDAHMLEMMGKALMDIPGSSVDDIITSLRKNRFSIARNEYHSLRTMRNFSLQRLQMSYDYVQQYIENHYHGPKKLLSKKLLNLVKNNKRSTDTLFNLMVYISFGTSFFYSALRNNLKI